MLNRLIQKLDAFIDWSGRIVSWLSLALVLVTFIVVVMRYLFDSGSIALQESMTYLHACVFLVGMAYTLQHDGHVRVDIFYSRLSATGKAWVDLFGACFLLLPFMLFISWISWEYISESWAVHEGSREAGGLPGVFLLKSLILVMTTLLSLQAVVQIYHNLQTLLQPPQETR
ncbi:MAG TPA: TRAP transporter small permease subunit [Thiotrichales bacterium]|nr:TRAP transporter small permease subunit [Thiotrichales bacterium]